MNNAFLLAITLGCMMLLSSCQISTQIEYPQCSTPTFRLFPIIGEIRVYLFSDPATTIVYEHDPRGNIPRDPHQNSPIYDERLLQICAGFGLVSDDQIFWRAHQIC